ncbi:Uncharacterised protein [Nocardia africana]|uniref:Uncharacterized protein n=1 Tax=Nocardia africana TaxID=134964 RepID=A0A378WQC2_9NOCA|nr:Uncharacterised protein [Nocardia africana]
MRTVITVGADVPDHPHGEAQVAMTASVMVPSL